MSLSNSNHPKRKIKPKDKFKKLLAKPKPSSIIFKCQQSLNDTHLPGEPITKMCNPLAPYILKIKGIITPSMKVILFDWLMQASSQFGLQKITFHRCLNIVNDYLQLKQINKQRFQLLGATALFIAHKLEQIQLMKVQMYSDVTNNGFSCEEILEMEEDIYLSLRWKVSKITRIEELWSCMNKWDQWIIGTDYARLNFCHRQNQNKARITSVLEYLMFHNIQMEENKLILSMVFNYLVSIISQQERSVIKRIFNLFMKQHYKMQIKQIQTEIQAVQYALPSFNYFFTQTRIQNQKQTQQQQVQSEQDYAMQSYTSYLSLYCQFVNK